MRQFSSSVSAIAIVFAVLVQSLFCSGPARAATAAWEVGLRAGASYNNEDESFNQYDIVAGYGLPWSWQWGQAVQVDPSLTAAVGVLDGGGDTGFVGSAGFEFIFGSAAGESPLELRAGSALTLLSEDTYGAEDFGGPVQFTHHISLYYGFPGNLSAVARVQHMSNGGIYSRNPGLDMVMLALMYRF